MAENALKTVRGLVALQHITPCNFSLFHKVKVPLKGKIFESLEAIKEKVARLEGANSSTVSNNGNSHGALQGIEKEDSTGEFDEAHSNEKYLVIGVGAVKSVLQGIEYCKMPVPDRDLEVPDVETCRRPQVANQNFNRTGAANGKEKLDLYRNPRTKNVYGALKFVKSVRLNACFSSSEETKPQRKTSKILTLIVLYIVSKKIKLKFVITREVLGGVLSENPLGEVANLREDDPYTKPRWSVMRCSLPRWLSHIGLTIMGEGTPSTPPKGFQPLSNLIRFAHF
ncbi:hypothetical protein J6590_063854 [Homalodisca vitripennis]|nr:hypothetical protein J6590_063854 [Homalodisca vitripennis]